MKATPRTLIRAVQKDLSPQEVVSETKEGPQKAGARDLMKAFINVDGATRNDHSQLLDNPAFAGCYPKIVDKVFYLERYASELPRNASRQLAATTQAKKGKPNQFRDNSDPHESFAPQGFTGFEHCLIFINITLAVGIVITIIFLGLFFFFLNNALYLKEVIS
jgi:hypothetical protein